MNAQTEFDRLLNTIETMIDRNIDGENPGERLESLYEICDDREIAAYVESFSNAFRTTAIERAETMDENADLKQIISRIFAADAVNSVAFRFPKFDRPKVHHWIPKSYLKNFGTPQSSGRRNVIIRAMFFIHNTPVFGDIDDRAFAHKFDSENEKGYYHLSMEKFFGLTESRFTTSRTNSDVIRNIFNASLMFIQSVRCPHPNMGFIGSSIREIIDALVKSINSFDEIHVTTRSGVRQTIVAPYFPSYMKRTVKNGLAAYFPVDTNRVSVISEKSFDRKADFYKFTDAARSAIVKKAFRDKSPLICVNRAIADEFAHLAD